MGVSRNNVEISSSSKVKVNCTYVLTVASSAKNESRCRLYTSTLENLIFLHLPSATISKLLVYVGRYLFVSNYS